MSMLRSQYLKGREDGNLNNRWIKNSLLKDICNNWNKFSNDTFKPRYGRLHEYKLNKPQGDGLNTLKVLDIFKET